MLAASDRHPTLEVIEPGLRDVWNLTLGDPRVCVALLDGPVVTSSECLQDAELSHIKTLVSASSPSAVAARHGTHVASIIFGQHGTRVRGIAPRCRGLIVPIFGDDPEDDTLSCSQLDLARALLQALQHGANIINISGGQFEPTGTAEPILSDVIRTCHRQGVLILASVGNEGCECLHVPAALPAVLAVGAADETGQPLTYSNWGENYRSNGILAPGANVWGVNHNGEVEVRSGTSYATAIVTGVAALLVSLQLKLGQHPSTGLVRAALLSSAIGCNDDSIACRRVLAGRLNVRGAASLIEEGGVMVSKHLEADERKLPSGGTPEPPGDTVPSVERAVAHDDGHELHNVLLNQSTEGVRPREYAPASQAHQSESQSECSCGSERCTCGEKQSVQWVFALGQLGYDFGSQARRESLLQNMEGNEAEPKRLLDYLQENPWEASSILWTLNLESTPIYAIMPSGAFADEGYKRLRQFLGEQLDEGVERISVAGVIVGQGRLTSGQVVPIIQPHLRCMYSWTTGALAEAVSGPEPKKDATNKDRGTYERRKEGVKHFLERIYHELRNLGLTPIPLT